MTEAEAEAAFEAMMRESKDTEAQRTKEDFGAAALVRKFQAQLTADATYRDVFNPARDGDCLMRCAVKHEFDGSGESAEAADDGGRAEATSGGWQIVGSAPGKKGIKGGRGSKNSIGNNGPSVCGANKSNVAPVAMRYFGVLVALSNSSAVLLFLQCLVFF